MPIPWKIMPKYWLDSYLLSYHPLNKNFHHQRGNEQHLADHLSQSRWAMKARFQQKRGGANEHYTLVHFFTKVTKNYPRAPKYTEDQHHLSINFIRASSKMDIIVIIMSGQWSREGLGNLSLQQLCSQWPREGLGNLSLQQPCSQWPWEGLGDISLQQPCGQWPREGLGNLLLQQLCGQWPREALGSISLQPLGNQWPREGLGNLSIWQFFSA